MKVICPTVDLEKLVDILDTSKKGVYVFYYLCETFLKHPDLKDFFKVAE